MLWAWLMSFGLPFPLLALRAERRFRAVPPLASAGSSPEDLPSLSIIVPARNEEYNLQTLLPSLKTQDYGGPFETSVVDDHSSDRTAQIANDLDVQVIQAAALPEGWNGKPHACHIGALQARGDWLLFVDADTRLYQGCLQAAIRHAIQNGLDGLSLLLYENSAMMLDRLALMSAFAGLFAGMGNGQAFLNGQFILIRKDVYFASGGFSAVRTEALEDLALAKLLHQQNFRVPILLGMQAGEVRMYTDLRHLWSGLVRLGSGALRWSGTGRWLTALFITGSLTPIVAVPLTLFAGMPAGWMILAWGTVSACFLPWARRTGRLHYAVLAPFGALIVQLAAVTGLLRSLAGLGVPWKGRIV